MPKSSFNIAIDGPAGAGKSTIAKLVAKKLGMVYVDTGAMYRAIALFMLRKGIPAGDGRAVSEAVGDAHVALRYEGGIQRVLLDGEDVSEKIRSEEVGNATSAISVLPAVREHLFEIQRGLAAKSDVIMDGRDIGTCILPDADLKVFLTASARVRALRRYKELIEKGAACNLQEIEQDIRERDKRDSERPIAPLRQAEDAVLLDSSDLTIGQVIDEITALALSRGFRPD